MKLALAGPITASAFADDLHPPSAARAATIPPFGGQPLVILAKALLRRGHALTIFTLAPAVREEIVLDGPALRLCVGPLRPRHRAIDLFQAERSFLARAIRREQPDLAHAHWTYEFALAAIASGARTVVTAHDAPMNILRHYRDAYRVARTLMAVQALRQARHLTAVSPHVAGHLRGAMGCRKPIAVVPNGLSEEFFAPARRPVEPGRPVTFATVLNGWSKLKNAAAAIDAFARLRRRRPDVRMTMFGAAHGPDGAAHRWATARSMAAGIDFVGDVPHEELRQRLAAEIDVLVHPSLEESHGMGLCEAMALGLPVIGGRASGAVPWTLDDGRAGLLADVRSPENLSDAMETLAIDPARRARLGVAGRESVRRRFHIDVVAAAYESIYRRVHTAAAAAAA